MSKKCPECIKYTLSQQIQMDNSFVIIEPINIPSLTLHLNLSLDSIPKYLKNHNTTYLLRGIVAYQGEINSIHLGHFVAYGFRHNDKWTMYNDLLKKPEDVSPSTQIKCVLLFYTI